MAQCLSPFQKKDTREFVPCGKCYECKARRVSGWSFRLLKEAERSSSAFFLTLTYAVDHAVLTPNHFMTLVKSDLQKFFKKLRKNQHEKIKYYAVGEYGGKSLRPHYHVILFNARLDTLIGDRYARQVGYGNISLDGKEPFNCESWVHGHITVGKLTNASCAYTLKYISKNSRIPIHSRDDRQPEFSLMSKRLGDNYLETGHMEMWHKDDLLNRMYIPLLDGKKISIPRYFKEKIYTKHQRERIGIHVQNQLLNEEQKKTLSQLKRDDDIRSAKGVKNDENRNTIL